MSTSRCLLFAGFFLTPLALLGQEAQPNATPRTQGQAVRSGGQDSGHMNKFIANCLKNGNQKEVTLSRLAEQKASDEDVKAFAQQMVKDHSDFLAKLERTRQEGSASSGAAATSRTEIRSETRTNTNRDANDQNPATNRRGSEQDNDSSDDQAGAQNGQANRTAQGQAGQRTGRDATAQPGARTDVRVDTTRGDVTVGAAGAGMSGPLDQIVRMENEIAQRCLASAQRELSQKQGKEFDKCYMFMQVGAHMEMADKLTVFRNHASGELQQLIDEGLQTTQQHLQHAKQLAQRIDEGGAAGAATGVRRDASGGNRGASGANRDASGGTNVERRSGTNNGANSDSNRSGAGTDRDTSERRPNN